LDVVVVMDASGNKNSYDITQSGLLDLMSSLPLAPESTRARVSVVNCGGASPPAITRHFSDDQTSKEVLKGISSLTVNDQRQSFAKAVDVGLE
jgi:hypothetical protein